MAEFTDPWSVSDPSRPQRTKLLWVALRETMVLVIGLAFALLLAWIVRDGRPVPNQMPANPLLALFGSIGFCLVRAALVRRPADVSNVRWTFYQIVLALALVLLLLFEIGAGLLMGARGIPAAAWGAVGGTGVLYVLTYSLAEFVLGFQRDVKDW